MSRTEFPRAIKVAVIKRATRANGQIYCEDPRCGLPCRKFQIDHIIADSHGGKAVIENAQLLCELCFSVKNPQDTTIAAKIKRQTAAHLGASTRPVVKLQGRQFAKSERTANREPKLPCAGMPRIFREQGFK